jgi:hypothetical protein
MVKINYVAIRLAKIAVELILKSILPFKRPIDNDLKGVGGNFAVLCETPINPTTLLKII